MENISEDTAYNYKEIDTMFLLRLRSQALET